MFGTRISFSFSRIFRLRRRRTAGENASSANVSRISCSEQRPLSNKSRRPVSSQLAPVNTTPTPSTRRPRSFFIPSSLSPIAQSPLTTSPNVTSVPETPPTILIIGKEPPQSLPPAPTPPGNVGPQAQVDGGLLLEPPPAPNSRRVSFQLPFADTEDRPESPLSTCSTLVTEVGAQAEAEMAPEVPPEQPPAPEALDLGSVGLPSAEATTGSGRARPISLFSPQPVRADVSRFSLPVTPTAPTTAAGTDARGGRRESKRKSFMLPTSGSGSTKKEKRTTRWSRELNKPETQEVLRVLRGL